MISIQTQPAVDVRKNIRKFSQNKALLKKIAAVVLLLIGSWIYRDQIASFFAIVSDEEAITSFLAKYGALGAVIIFFILMLQVIIAAVPGHAFMIVGGYLYGFLAAFLIVHVSTVTASQAAYWLAKKYGRPIVKKLAPEDVVDEWTGKAERQGLVFFFFSFILPIFPSDVMNFVAGLSGISGRKFLIANFFGRLPTSILFTMIGAYGFGIPPWMLVLAVIFTIVAFTVWKKLGPAIERRQKDLKTADAA